MPWSKPAARVLGNRIRQRRKGLGYTQETLAHASGITTNAIQLIESGRGSARYDGPPSNMTLTTLFGIADALRIAPGELIRGLESHDPAETGDTDVQPGAGPRLSH
jgi:transcriptional regulator with XRE-family HTH domain